MFRSRHIPAAAAAAVFGRQLSRVAPPPDTTAEPVIRVFNNLARLGPPKEGPKPRQLLSLPPFSPAGVDPLPGRNISSQNSVDGIPFPRRVTAITWVKHYFDEVPPDVIQSHFRNGMIKHNHVMKAGMKIHVSVSLMESKILKRYDTIPTATLNPNADEIEYLRRLVIYKDSAIIVLNKPPRVPVKGHLPVHNSMDVLASAALSYGSEEGPKLVHRLDKESSGLLLLGRKKESFAKLQCLFTNFNHAKTSSQLLLKVKLKLPNEGALMGKDQVSEWEKMMLPNRKGRWLSNAIALPNEAFPVAISNAFNALVICTIYSFLFSV